MKHFLSLVSLVGAFAFPPPATAAPGKTSLEIALPGKSAALTLDQMKAKLKVSKIEIDDPVYRAKKAFDGFLLLDVLRLGGWEGSGDDEIVFVAADGYSPNTTIAKLRANTAYLVFQEHGTPGKFGKVAQGKAMVSPAPFYVAWAEGKALEHEVPWPYQLVKIEIVNFAQKYPKLYPAEAKADSEAMRGFTVFKNECLRCHSVNLQGGDLGPELNIPKNITEYWDEDHLKAFIVDATSYRAKSKMPPFKHLKEKQIDELVEYLSYMKKRKMP